VWTSALRQGWPAGPGIVVPHLSGLLSQPSRYLGAEEDLSEVSQAEADLILAAALECLGDPDEEELERLAQAGQTLGTPRVPAWLLAAARALDAKFGQAARRVILSTVKEVASYLERTQVRYQVRAALFDAMRPDLVIAHSLGSVIALDIAVHYATVPRLVTMGSPLALRAIREHEALASGTYPPPADWINIHDPGDLVTVGTGLGGVWPAVTDIAVRNKLHDAHAARYYLAHDETGAAVAGLLRGGVS
jgi:hypothetical protein